MLQKTVIWFGLGFAALALLLWASTFLWQGLGSGITGHGWIAYVLGGVFTLALSMGLMMLSFYSARHGHDEIEPALPDDRSDI